MKQLRSLVDLGIYPIIRRCLVCPKKQLVETQIVEICAQTLFPRFLTIFIDGLLFLNTSDSPDSWIPRDPRLVRLTGNHPFNCEARLNVLFAEGFLTPSNLFYVRNHGAPPKVNQDMANKWEIKIHGYVSPSTVRRLGITPSSSLCSKPVTLTLDDLRSKFAVVTLPVTFVCAGNRRKEQNVVKHAKGFNWGAGAVSTALFTGVRLSDILKHVAPTELARYVIFEGCDDVPKGPYGTRHGFSSFPWNILKFRPCLP
jgi:nitrate reductase (NAD(P)H)